MTKIWIVFQKKRNGEKRMAGNYEWKTFSKKTFQNKGHEFLELKGATQCQEN